jgi:HSP20 family protein
MGVATRFDPFRELERLFDQTVTGSQTVAAMPMDLFRDGDHYVIRVDLPGADPGSIDVSVDDRMLTIRGQRNTTGDNQLQWLVQERPSGTFARQIALGRGISLDNISATYTDGVLSLTVPVAQEAKPRRIEVSLNGNPSTDGGHTVDAAASQQQIDA